MSGVGASTATGGTTARQRYGPWAVIAGASEGTGRAFARQVAAAGLDCVLLARRPGPLEALADELRADFGAAAVPLAVDLSEPDALERIREVTDGLEVGLYVANAGADPYATPFLDRDVEDWVGLVNRNVVTTMRCCHHFGGLMRGRGHGGLLLVGSGACYGGGRLLAAYSGSKAFELCFAESLWAELRGTGVDVLFQALVTTDTPALRELLAEGGQRPPSRLVAPADVASTGLAHLDRGPVYNSRQLLGLRAGTRRLRVRLVTRLSRSVFGDR
jgi:short-subunit dehydrogenase